MKKGLLSLLLPKSQYRNVPTLKVSVPWVNRMIFGFFERNREFYSQVPFYIGFLLLVVGLLGCGKQEGGFTGGGGYTPLVASGLFNVSGAKAIATASSSQVTGSALKALQTGTVTELLKLNASGEVKSVFSELFSKQWHPPISVIETGPDGSLYVGFEWGIWIQTSTSTLESGGKEVAFFRVTPAGSVEIVDENIRGVGTWYGDRQNGELPNKQVQFYGTASSYDVYYLAKTSSGNTILKKKTAAGVISQIGSASYAVRDFVICPNGFVLFHGSNAGNWSIEWLKVYYGSEVNNIFYNDGAGWLRAYYYSVVNGSNYIFLVGENLTLENQLGATQKYSGIVRVSLDATGKQTKVEALYDDNNMYSETYNTIGDQLVWGFWDPTEMTNKKFFVTDNYNTIQMPTSLETGVTSDEIRAYIRKKYQSTSYDNLNNLSFVGLSTSEAWRMSNYLTDLVASYVTGETWAKWRQRNDLQNVRFGNAKQLLFTASNELYAVLSLDQWGSGSSKGEKLFRIVNSSGAISPEAYLQDTVKYYKSMSKARVYRASNGKDYVVYLSNKVGKFKIYRLDLGSPSTPPEDMIPLKTNIEIFSFNYNPVNSMLYYDVYDLSNNTSYLAQQEITSTTITSSVSAEGYTITDVVPFTATN